MESEKDGRSIEGEAKKGGDKSVVKSVTRVRFPRGERFSPYSRLELNTDLRQPPPNWLRSGPTIQVPNTWIKGEPAEISSFGMADSEILDDVDVISASENIKKLLKIPFSKDQVSLAVHRIGKTLLLDKLDLYKHLRKASQGERKWLKDVFIRLLQESEGANVFHGRQKTSESVQTSNLLSKFLYHSLGGDLGYSVEEPEDGPTPALDKAIQQLPSLTSPPPQNDVSQFARQFLWQFEDIRMLIGTDLPIFGGGTYPAVSLRLRDAQSPINVLTGLDYWLDNLMCNVPELVMCYHLDGFVQKYELIKTEEIPTFENAQFHPKVVKNIAQNILSFINSNCTKEGHTYWLFKGQGDDVVKLYDLSSLISKNPECRWDNPFIAPVAMLLYRVAHNMAQSANISTKDRHIIVTLIDKCLSLLAQCREPHSEIVAQANYILCQMYMEESRSGRQSDESSTASSEGVGSAWAGGSTTSSEVDDNSDHDEDDDEQDEEEDDQEESHRVSLPPISVNSLTKPTNKAWNRRDSKHHGPKVKSLDQSQEERARHALEYVAKGLKVIKASTPSGDKGTQEPPSDAPPSHSSIHPALPPSSPERKAIKHSDNSPSAPSSGVNEKGYEMGESDYGSAQSRSSDKSDSNAQRANDAWNILPIEPRKIDGNGEATSGSLTSEIQETERQSHCIQSPSGNQPESLSDVGECPSKELDVLSTALCKTSDGADTQRDQARTDSHSEMCSDLVPSGASDGAKRVAKEKPFPPGSWQETSGLLLLEKAYKAYCVLTQRAWKGHRHGKALIHAHLAVKCLNACRSIHDLDGTVSSLLMMCGDSHLLLTHDPSNHHLHHEDYQNLSQTDTFILEAAVIQQNTDEFEWATEFQTETEDCLECSIKCYKICLEQRLKKEKSFKKNVRQKMGNACNELGVFFMNTANNLASLDDSLPSTFEQQLWKESYRAFDSGIKAFEEVGDTTNMALLNCNMGRLMRLCAQSYAAGGSAGPKGEFSSQEKHYCIKATECYSRALHHLGNKRGQPSLWESVTWELCSTHFNMACTLQDHPPISTSTLTQIEKDVLEAMSKALALCDTEETSSSRQPLYQYRAATIHHRLASMYHNANRKQSAHMKEKHTRSLSELHYTKAARLFRELDRPVELLRVELERVALLEHQLEGQTGSGSRVKTLESALSIMLDCSSVIPQLERLSYKLVPTTKGPPADAPSASVSAADVPSPKPPSYKEVTASQRRDPAMKNVDRHGGRVGGGEGGENAELKQEKGEFAQQSSTSECRLTAATDAITIDSGQDGKRDDHDDGKKGGNFKNAKEGKCKGKEEGGKNKGGIAKSLSKGENEQGQSISDRPGMKDGKKRTDAGAKEGDGGKEREGEDGDAEGTKSEADEVKRLLTIFESRLQFILLNLVKFLSSSKKRSQEKHLSMYKQMYAASLGRLQGSGGGKISLSSRLDDINRISSASR